MTTMQLTLTLFLLGLATALWSRHVAEPAKPYRMTAQFAAVLLIAITETALGLVIAAFIRFLT
ncbi:Uncharacterised protein [Pseudomonas luteola]|uniref:Uncharacterized protein n=1 Tax=Pseudomonas luteola TaxID=47886 RepID=A0A2X2CLE5_PSELU|nr:hypothetical protein [Pseudomonas luteola]SPZ07601.1 Uncharacterised protein [Pseudomonas luteola]